MTLTEHLAELRARLLRCVAAIAIGFFVAYSFHEELFEVMARPVLKALRAHGIPGLQALQVTETITVYLQVSLVAAVIGTAPYLFYQAWAFVAPGLYARERRLVSLVAGLVSGFFFLGVLFCYAVFLPLVVDYLVGFTEGSGTIRLLPTVEKTFSIVTLFPLVFGLVFQLPLVMFLLSLLGLFDYKQLLKVSRYFVVLAFILGAIFTPPDPLSQVLMAVPITLLFFVGVAFAWVGGLLRAGGRRTVARIVAGGVVGVFAVLVVASAIAWNLPRHDPDPADLVADDAAYAVRLDPASRLGKAALAALGVSLPGEGMPRWVLVTSGPDGRRVWAWGPALACAGMRTDEGVCLLQGASGEPPVPRTRVSFSLEQAVAALLRAPCLARLSPADLSRDVVLRLGGGEDADGLVRASWTLSGATAPWRAWVERARDEWTPGGVPAGLVQTPIGRALAWSAGDIEVSEGPVGLSIALAFTPGRAARSIAEVLSALSACDGEGG